MASFASVAVRLTEGWELWWRWAPCKWNRLLPKDIIPCRSQVPAPWIIYHSDLIDHGWTDGTWFQIWNFGKSGRDLSESWYRTEMTKLYLIKLKNFWYIYRERYIYMYLRFLRHRNCTLITIMWSCPSPSLYLDILDQKHALNTNFKCIT